jgi:hypothetical protein
MKKWIAVLIFLCAYTMIYAQQLTVSSVSMRLQDARAASQPRTDAKGMKCAIVHVGIVGVDDLLFSDAVGNVERNLSEYIVYVPNGLSSLHYKSKSGRYAGEIVFDDYGLNIESLLSYEVILETDSHFRSAVFSIHPKNATLILDGKTFTVNNDGIVVVEKPVGNYDYYVKADGYISQSGTIELTEDKITSVSEIVLEELLYPVSIKVFPNNATVFIDNIPHTVQSLSNLQLSKGSHSIRVTAPNCKDEKRTINVTNSMSTEYFALKEAKHEVVIHKEESSKTGHNIRNALYFSFGLAGYYAKEEYDANIGGVKFELSSMFHFGSAFAMRVGAGVSLTSPTYSDDFEYREILEDSVSHISFDAPLQLGVSIPFGKYNRHLFSIFGGVYGRASFYIGNSGTSDKFAEILENHYELGDYYDYGFRASIRIDFSKFTIGFDFDRSLNGFGNGGCITAGWKIPISKVID